MIFRLEWLALALILYILHRIFGIPLAFTFYALIAWVVVALLITLLLTFANSAGNAGSPSHSSRRASDRIYSKRNYVNTDEDDHYTTDEGDHNE
jgi:hypothetical protein